MSFLIVSNHPIYVDGLKVHLKRLFKMESILGAECYENAFKMLDEKENIEIVLLDTNIPQPNWKECVGMIIKKRPEMKTVVLSNSTAMDDIKGAFDIGVTAFVPKSYPIKLLTSTVRFVMDGGTYFPSFILQEISSHIPSEEIEKTKASYRGDYRRHNSLTARQEEVLNNLSKGYSNKQIAYVMNVSEATVKLHMNSLLRTLGVSNRTHAVITAQKLGMLPADNY